MSLLIIDLEATCEEGSRIPPDEMEIIEIGAVLVDESAFGKLDQFNAFVRPAHRPRLTAFCTELTSITQDMVDGAGQFPAVAQKFGKWLDRHGRIRAWSSWGGYDYKQFDRDCKRHGVKNPLYMPHVNLKTLFAQAMGRKPMGMKGAFAMLNAEMDGRHHRGIDDALNMARLLTMNPRFAQAMKVALINKNLKKAKKRQ